ncbi:hypothetical protein HZB07_06055 [Candidatus Saganbacteria bacterium]|nr:hypothetical protein [Candidatus Saganbacteria bacterium]
MKGKILTVVLVVCLIVWIWLMLSNKGSSVVYVKVASVQYGKLVASVSAIGKVKSGQEKIVRAKAVSPDE